MKKQLLLFLLMLLPVVASADAVEIGGIYYNLIPKAKQAEVTSNPNKYTGSVDIPPSFTHDRITYSVTSIVDNAFLDCFDLTSVTIPNSVTAIGEYAFYRCDHLTSLIIPNSVTTIGEYAFYNCYNLASVTISNSVTTIGVRTFGNCKGITSLTIPNNVTTIGAYAFENCTGLTSVSIPNSVTTIGQSAFYNCTGLTSVTIPNSVTSIGNGAFETCTGLTSMTIPNSVTTIGKSAFRCCFGLTSITIPNSVVWIGEDAFEKCSSLTSVNIPNSVSSINDGTFKECSNLCSVTISNSVTYIGQSAFNGCTSLTSVTIPNSVISIGGNAFYGCTGLTSVTIPNSVTTIGNGAFSGCSGLTTVTIGSGMETIGSQAFATCPELTDVYCYAEQVPNTSKDAFQNSYIEYATLHVPATSIDAYKATEPWSLFNTKVAISVDEPIDLIPDYISETAGGFIPEGYIIKFRDEERTASTGSYGMGSRVFGPFVEGSDFTQAIYFREGYVLYGGLEGYELSLKAGVTYKIHFNSFMWDESGERMQFEILNSADQVVLSREIINAPNINGNMQTVITGSTSTDIDFVPIADGNYRLKWIADGFYHELLANVSMKYVPNSTEPETPKCATPTISYDNGELVFDSETEGVEFVSEITDADIKKSFDSHIPLTKTYNITVYATKAGYEDSDVATATLCWIDAEPGPGDITTQVAEVRANPVLITSNGGILSLTGVPAGTNISVYNLSGQMVGSATATAGATQISTTLGNGEVAIVKIGSRSVKVMVK